MYYVYIIQSLLDNSYYKGFNENPIQRLEYHNKSLSTYTSSKTHWKLVAVFEFDTKTEALQKEKKIKKYTVKSLEALINSNQNKLDSIL